MTEQLSLLGDVAPDPSLDPPDQPARDRTEHDLDATLFVEAGAGSGKTRALVSRIVALVTSGIALENIAAITFTEKAANELRQRVRQRLGEVVAAPETSDGSAAAAGQALNQLDSAAISTLHAFAQRLLFEHPIEAGLPPGVDVLDEIASQVDFDERWDNHVASLLANGDLTAALLLADVFGIGVGDLRTLALQLESNWDLVAERMPDAPVTIDVDTGPFIESLRQLDGRLSECSDQEDGLAARIVEAEAYRGLVESATADTSADPVDRLVDLAELLVLKHPIFSPTPEGPYKRLGAKKNWADAGCMDDAKQALYEAGLERDELRGQIAAAAITQLARAIGDFVLDAAADRRTEGRLRFHDLLVLARELVRHPTHGADVRTALRDRYQRLLIDEFQDTDPIQVELATLLAASRDAPIAEWNQTATEPGRLFFVGDPKQSIYRFRRADISVYLRAQQHFGGTDGTLALTANFRSSEPIIAWVNAVFGALIVHEVDSQPAYAALDAQRDAPPSGPGVVVLGNEAHPDGAKADDLRRAEADDVASTVLEALADQWPVLDRTADGEQWRPARLGDITILLPARTSLLALERALERANIPYRAETASLVYATPEVRTLLLVARAVDDPSDELAVVAALRSHAFGCGDDDLAHYRSALRGSWNHQALSDDLPGDDIVVQSLRWLRDAHNDRAWLSPALVLDRIVAERHLMELGVVELRHREVWRRLRFVIDQARAWTDTTGGSLREYLGWVRLQASESARIAETVLPESDTDAVRIMTVHASKGLEFPIAIVSGLTTRPTSRLQAVTVVWPSTGPPGYRLKGGTTTPEYDEFSPIDELLDNHERLRLLYVACTRAQDHLVVSLHRTAKGSRSLADVLHNAGAAHGVLVPSNERRAPLATPAADAVEAMDTNVWSQRRDMALASGSRSRTIAATTLAQIAAAATDDAGLQKQGRDLDLPPWQKGRYGTAVGRAVHAVLQTADFDDPGSVVPAAAAQTAAESILGQEDVVAALARAALASPIVREASQAQYWRELFVAAPLGDRLLEGYIDLLFRRGPGLVIVDYKTDAWGSEADLDAKVERYRIQTAAYAVALEAATGLDVIEAVLLFVAEDGSVARRVPRLDEAKTEVVALAPTVIVGGEADYGDR